MIKRTMIWIPMRAKKNLLIMKKLLEEQRLSDLTLTERLSSFCLSKRKLRCST